MISDALLPTRYRNREQALALFGGDADRYARLYLQSDPTADALAAWIERAGEPARAQFEQSLRCGLGSVSDPPVELARFFERAEALPSWVDFEELRLGALAYQRFGLMGMIILGAWSLINGYHSSAAVKPLAFTGELEHRTQRRLAATAKFVSEVSQVDGLHVGRPGREISLRVCLIHAHVRQACFRSQRWRTEDWGIPINQADMFGTLLEFSLLMIDGAQQLGFVVNAEERQAILSMWRYCGHLSGVDPWLLDQLGSEAKTRRIAELIRLVQPGPDEDSLVLTRQLLRVPGENARGRGPHLLAVAVSRFHNGLARAFNGPKVANDLGIPDDIWKYSVYPVRAVVRPLEWLRGRIPGASELASNVGNRAIRTDLTRMLRGTDPTFERSPP
ncbi:MAG: oxygenase MpaB family protein [Polyangiales bacterium]